MSKNYFADWANRLDASGTSPLPLTHLTSAYTARSIVDDGELKVSDCKRMGKKLVYMFYGTVSYVLPEPQQVSKVLDCPVCFVLDGQLIEEICHAYPFDTGAFKDKLFSEQLSEKFFLENFNLTKAKEKIPTLIEKIYPNKKDYVVGNTRNIANADQICGEGEFEVREYIALLLSQVGSNLDKRIGSFELAFDKNISLSDWLKCVILPDLLLSKEPISPWVESIINSHVEVIPYAFTSRASQYTLNSLIEAQFLSYCETNSLLK